MLFIAVDQFGLKTDLLWIQPLRYIFLERNVGGKNLYFFIDDSINCNSLLVFPLIAVMLYSLYQRPLRKSFFKSVSLLDVYPVKITLKLIIIPKPVTNQNREVYMQIYVL